ncbi:hypothetical protein M752DRAFT_27706 [Aspergillus phoenicis ATCC 13157]|uniref:Uncharacterized protein n=1 Tax=Aspergillus phoenicis ATCC 13157 TaxID=1353007 RepID=A0A370PHX2_ASPPH|nr:hypothetical protein M752DRAFT_27706 [Aspergillus phoenicis ATCC 13157]
MIQLTITSLRQYRMVAIPLPWCWLICSLASRVARISQTLLQGRYEGGRWLINSSNVGLIYARDACYAVRGAQAKLSSRDAIYPQCTIVSRVVSHHSFEDQ